MKINMPMVTHSIHFIAVLDPGNLKTLFMALLDPGLANAIQRGKKSYLNYVLSISFFQNVSSFLKWLKGLRPNGPCLFLLSLSTNGKRAKAGMQFSHAGISERFYRELTITIT